MINFIVAALSLAKSRSHDQRDKAERAAIAKAFNDRYTFRLPFRPTGERRRFTPGDGLDDWFPDQAWMCPSCNVVHMTLGRSWLTGMHFPKCCDHFEGHRHNDNIRMPG